MRIITSILTIILGVFIISLLTAVPAWLLWNWLMPDIFNLSTISLLQAWGLTFLSGIFLELL